MTSTLLACYRHPADPEAFDQHYADNHSKLALALPGLRSYTGTWPGPGPDGAAPPDYFVAARGGGAAAVEDLGNFAGAGVDMLTGPTTTYS